MSMETGTGQPRARPSQLAVTGAVYLLFVTLGVLSRSVPVAFVAMILFGDVFPVGAVRRATPRGVLGYTRHHLGASLGWATLIGVVMLVLTAALYGEGAGEQPLPGLQLAVGLLIWLGFMSPFQENLFRGWIQPRLQQAWGRIPGLLVTSVAFAAWHLAPPFTGTATSSVPIATPVGLATALTLGLLTGLARERTGSMIGPWLGQALAGLALVASGQMTFLQYQA